MGIEKLEFAVVLIGLLSVIFYFFVKKTKVVNMILIAFSTTFILLVVTIAMFFFLSTPVNKEKVNKIVYSTKKELTKNTFLTNETKLVYGDEYATYQIETTWKWLFLEKKVLSEYIIEFKTLE